MGIDLKKALTIATAAALEAGALIRAEFHRRGGPRHSDRNHALVDEEAEAIIRARLLEAFPECGYVGEETQPAVRARDGATWFVDPNDGTKAFIEGWRGSAVSIALVQGDVPVLGVVHAPVAPDDAGDLVTWAEGEPLRRNGRAVTRAALPKRLSNEDVVLVSQDADRNSAANASLCAPARFRAIPGIAYRLALLAVGEGDVAVSLNGPVAWDFAGGHALVRAVGGDLVDQGGRPIRYGPSGASGRWVFGGSLETAQAVAKRPWEQVFERGEAPGSLDARYPLVRPSHRAKVADAGVLARAQGCLLGQVAGDALGQLVEFRSAADIAREYPTGVRELRDGGSWNTIAGQPTDDSELALMLARSLVNAQGFNADQARAAYVAWGRSGPFDIGGTTSAALRGRLNRENQANGSLMRVSPLAIFAESLGADEVGRLARADSDLTHPNRVCGDAVAVFSVAIAHAVHHGGDARAIYDAAMRWARSASVDPSVIRTLEDAAGGRPKEYVRQQGWVLIALGNAFFQLLHAPSLEEGLVDTVGCGGDTDTNGAIAGALLGAVHGRDAVPMRWSRAVLSCRPIHTARARPRSFWPVDAFELAEVLVAIGSPRANEAR